MQIGTYVRPGDILVGKVSPKPKTELTPEWKKVRKVLNLETMEYEDLERPTFPCLEDAKKKDIVVAASGKGSETYIFPKFLNSAIGTRLRPPTFTARSRATRRGSVDMDQDRTAHVGHTRLMADPDAERTGRPYLQNGKIPCNIKKFIKFNRKIKKF